MKIDLEQEIQTFEGEAITLRNKALTVRRAFGEACLSQEQGDRAEDKERGYKLAKRLLVEEVDSFDVDDLAFIKKRCGSLYTPYVYGWLCERIFS